jgi:hypothetical protein
MSDWEDFCDGLGWKNDEHATDKLIDYIEGKSQRPYASRQGRGFPTEQKPMNKEEERRFFSTPIGQYIARYWGRGNIFNITEKRWIENGSNFKSLYFEIYIGFFHMTITKRDETNFIVEFCNITGRSPLCTQTSGARLTPNLIEQAVSKNEKLVNAENNR